MYKSYLAVNQKTSLNSEKSPIKETKFSQYVSSMMGSNQGSTPKPKVMTAKQKARDVNKCLNVKRMNMSASVKQIQSSSIPRDQNVSDYRSKLSELKGHLCFYFIFWLVNNIAIYSKSHLIPLQIRINSWKSATT